MGSTHLLSLPPLQQIITNDPRRNVKLYSVISRKAEIGLPPEHTNFTLQEEQCDLSGENGVIAIQQDPYITIYCFDFQERRAYFIKTPEDKDLYTFPFFYLAQLQNATHVYSVPIELLEKVLLGDPLNSDFVYNTKYTSLQSENQIMFLFSTGRCGSTLLCKVLDKIPGVLGLQEPDCYTAFACLRNSGGATDKEIVTMLRISVIAHCKPTIHHPGDVKKWIFKFASYAHEYMDLFPLAFPHSQHLFMYRNAEAVTKSFSKMVSDLNQEMDAGHEQLCSGLKLIPKKGHSYTLKDFASVFWLSTISKVLHFKQAGMQVQCVRYEELVAEPEKVVRELAKLYNISMQEEDIPKALDAMKGHSQEGTYWSIVHEQKELPEVLTAMRQFVSDDKEIGSLDFILPDTILRN